MFSTEKATKKAKANATKKANVTRGKRKYKGGYTYSFSTRKFRHKRSRRTYT